MSSSSHLIDCVADTTAHRDRDDLDHALAQLLIECLEAQCVSIFRLRDDNGTPRLARRVVLQSGNSQPEPPDAEADVSQLRALADVPPWQRCVTSRERVQYTESDGSTRDAFPIQAEQKVVGVLEIVTAAPPLPRDTALVSGILRIMKNHLALLDYGERDTLTGLLNRKTFEVSFEKLRHQANRVADAQSEPTWLGIADIDKFKSINDTYGHLFGDEVLLLVSQLIKKTFRGGDLLFRFGGEEFVIVLEHANAAGAQIAFERLRSEIESFRFPQVGQVTISLGYTRIGPHEASATCIERADEALYYAKHHGRNSVRSFEALVTAGELQPKTSGDDIELF